MNHTPIKWAIMVISVVGLADYFGGQHLALYALMVVVWAMGNSLVERSVDLDRRVKKLKDKLERT